MDLTFDSRLDPSLKVGFSTARSIFLSRDRRDLAGNWCHINATSVFHSLDSDSSINFLGPNFCSQTIGTLDVLVSLVFDPSVDVP